MSDRSVSHARVVSVAGNPDERGAVVNFNTWLKDRLGPAGMAGSTGHSESTPGRNTWKGLKSNFFCALGTGCATAAFFNPWDKALYLSVKEKRPFLDRLNWKQPFSGTLQAVTSRTLNIGLYFPLEFQGQRKVISGAEATESDHRCLHKKVEGQDSSESRILISLTLFTAGNLAGLTCAILSHPLNVTKYAYWNGHSRGFWGAFRLLYSQGGAASLYRGFAATMARDSLFGGVYSCLRHHMMFNWGHLASSLSSGGSLNKTRADEGALLRGFALNTLAACVAVAASSPLNYVRNMQFAAPPHAPEPRMLPVLRGLGRQVAQASWGTAKVVVLSRNLLLGWGTLRAAVGMGFGSAVYDSCKHGVDTLG